MARTTAFVMVPANVQVPVGLIIVCKKYQIPIIRSAPVEPGVGWLVPGVKSDFLPVPVIHAPLVIPPDTCYHRAVRIDYETGLEICDNKLCGHVFRKFEPVKSSGIDLGPYASPETQL